MAIVSAHSVKFFLYPDGTTTSQTLDLRKIFFNDYDDHFISWEKFLGNEKPENLLSFSVSFNYVPINVEIILHEWSVTLNFETAPLAWNPNNRLYVDLLLS